MSSVKLFMWLLLFAVSAGSTLAQQPPQPMSAEELTRLYVEHAATKLGAGQNYTFLLHAHNIAYNGDRKTSDWTEDSEQVFIGGLPYNHRLARDGKPLAGKDLKHEDELYQKAVKERTGLTDIDRWKASKKEVATIDVMPRDHFVFDFRQEILGHDVVDGHDCFVLDLIPLHPDGPSELQLHIRLSLEAKTFDLVHYRVETLAQIGEYAKGSAFEGRAASIDGVWLQVFSSTDAIFEDGHRAPVRLIDTVEFSNFRQFRTSATINDAPAGQAKPPH